MSGAEGMIHLRSKNLVAAAKDFSDATNKLLTFRMNRAGYFWPQRLKVTIENHQLRQQEDLIRHETIGYSCDDSVAHDRMG